VVAALPAAVRRLGCAFPAAEADGAFVVFVTLAEDLPAPEEPARDCAGFLVDLVEPVPERLVVFELRLGCDTYARPP
jgi:hypothetical protein